MQKLQQLDHRADAASLRWGQLMSFQNPRHYKGLTPTLTFPAPTPRPLSGIEAGKSHRVGLGRRRQEGARTPGSQGAEVTIQGGCRKEGCCEPRPPAPLLVPLSHKSSLAKGKFKGVIIQNFKTPTTEH